MALHQTTISEAPASEAGALDGFSIHCADCGAVGGSGLRTLAQEWARDHTAYMVGVGK